MGKKGKEAARQRREQRRREVTLLRAVPYEPHQRWWWWDGLAPGQGRAVAVVTGANRGIGYEVARQLARHGLHVVLTSRGAARGRDAAEQIRAEGGPAVTVSVESRQLDVADAASVESFAAWVERAHGGIHVLVNNAGVNFNRGADNSVEFAEQVIETNYFGTKRMIEAMMPLMKTSPHGGRVVNVSSRLGRVNGRRNRIGDASLRERLLDDDHLSEELIDEMVMEFLEQTKQDNWSSNEWPQMYTDYSVSKLAVNSYTRLLARRLSNRPEGQKIYVNCFCPGWVKTAMTGWEGNISAEEGADTGVWLALLQQDQSTIGKFFAERREISF
ncbi:carbonyl reductase [NADPH] 3-like [Oryza brachyantha]|uniref:carbonyl reductase [NADPH] 3-like n=1 Tax=Oryza brachyantha TaxID=4533 RepID=UPI001ADA80D0|nr:carbonyl reductase [NADPH] 3-like [Oryza brachyantha]